MNRRRWFWLAAGALGLAVWFFGAQVFSAERFRERAHQALERSLQRKVRIGGAASFRVYPVVGFRLEDVTIAENADWGLEPFAFMPALDAQIDWRQLLSGRLGFSRLRLEEPSVNVMKRSAGGWNVQPLLTRALGTEKPSEEDVLPVVEVRNGRINFKFDEQKAALYLTEALMDLEPQGRPGDYEVYLEAKPARTDRQAQGLGNVRLRGTVSLGGGAGGQEARLSLVTELASSSLSELALLVSERSLDLNGKMSATLRMDGAPSRLKLAGAMRVEGATRSGLSFFRNQGLNLPVTGEFSWSEQKLFLESARGESAGFRLRGASMLSHPRYAVLFALNAVPLEPLIAPAGHPDHPLPEGAKAAANLSGRVGFSSSAGLRGMLWMDEAKVKVAEAPELAAPHVEVIVEQDELRLTPVSVMEAGAKESMLAGGVWDWRTGAVRLDLQSEELSLARARESSLLLRTRPMPLLDRLRGGKMQGRLQYLRKSPADDGVWSGEANISDAKLEHPALQSALEIQKARVLFDESRVRMEGLRGRCGKIPVAGQWQDPDQLTLELGRIEWADLLQVLGPLWRPERGLARGLVDRALGAKRIPEWMQQQQLAIALRAKTLELAPNLSLQNVDAQVNWKQERMKLAQWRATVNGVPVRGAGELSLLPMQQAMDLSFESNAIGFHGGKAVVAGKLTGPWQSANLQLELRGSLMELGGERFRQFRSQAEGLLNGNGFALAKGSFEGESAEARWSGTVAPAPQGRFAAQLQSNAQRTLNLNGQVWPPRLDP
jgi:hypothetical protein